MNRYLLFFGPDYYPSGGMLDCKGTFKDKKDALTVVNEFLEEDGMEFNWWHIFDCELKKIVFSNDGVKMRIEDE